MEFPGSIETRHVGATLVHRNDTSQRRHRKVKRSDGMTIECRISDE